MKFRAILPTAFAGIFATCSALAADLPVRPVPLPVPAFTWTGFYSGIELGGISGEFHRPFSFATPPLAVAPSVLPLNEHKDRSSAVAGSRGGYLHQFGMFVIGIEGGTQVFSLTERRNPVSQLPVTPAIGSAFLLEDAAALHSGWQSSVRGRLGLAWDRFMLYGTGGVAFTTVRIDTQFVGLPLSGFVKDKSLTGYTVGIGAEWAITDATSIGVEYRHTEYDRANPVTSAIPLFATIVPVQTKVDFSNDAVMLTYNLRFGRIFPQLDWRL